MRKSKKGSLTAQEYEEIYYFLNEYNRIVNLDKIQEPFYVKDVRLCNLQRLKNITKKMKRRMVVEYPNSFAT